MKSDERAYREYKEYDELLTKLQRELRQLSDQLIRDYEQQLMQKIADNPEFASKYDPNQPRDDHGRWTSGGKSGMDIGDALKRLNDQALPGPKGYCATYVREAIIAGGVPLKDFPEFAKDYGPYLEKYGFEKLKSKKTYWPRKGDIAVLQPPTNGTHPDGHIQMFNGKQWVSDFKQPGFWPDKNYADYPSSYEIYLP